MVGRTILAQEADPRAGERGVVPLSTMFHELAGLTPAEGADELPEAG